MNPVVEGGLKDTVYDVRKTIDAQAGRFIDQTYGIVSAGGQGVRLRPRTIELPKPLIEVGLQKQPLMYWSMLPMILGGVSHFIVGVRYGAENIRSKFEEGGELSNRFGREITIEYVEEPEPLGRAGFIRYGIQQ
ncbi:MAG: sugar phosphate nucleotidyltransferase, partial [Candidatus Bathyarchaeia archaeon]